MVLKPMEKRSKVQCSRNSEDMNQIYFEKSHTLYFLLVEKNGERGCKIYCRNTVGKTQGVIVIIKHLLFPNL